MSTPVAIKRKPRTAVNVDRQQRSGEFPASRSRVTLTINLGV
jgi:hypothetical protein